MVQPLHPTKETSSANKSSFFASLKVNLEKVKSAVLSNAWKGETPHWKVDLQCGFSTK